MNCMRNVLASSECRVNIYACGRSAFFLDGCLGRKVLSCPPFLLCFSVNAQIEVVASQRLAEVVATEVSDELWIKAACVYLGLATGPESNTVYMLDPRDWIVETKRRVGVAASHRR